MPNPVQKINENLIDNLPLEILVLMAKNFDFRCFIALTNTCYYLSECQLRDEIDITLIVDEILATPNHKMFNLTQILRPIIYRVIEAFNNDKLTTDEEFKAYFCYALVIENINELDIDKLDQLQLWLYKQQDIRYRNFTKTIGGILGILLNNQDIFSTSVLTVRYSDAAAKPYFNFSGAYFSSGFFPESANGKYHDLQFANLEFSTWSQDVNFNDIIFSESIQKAIFFESNDFSSIQIFVNKLNHFQTQLLINNTFSIEYDCPGFKYIRYGMVANILRFIEEDDRGLAEKLDLLNYAINHPIFVEHRDKVFRNCQKFFMTLFDKNHQLPKTKSQEKFAEAIVTLEQKKEVRRLVNRRT